MLFERALTHLEPTSIQPTQCRHRSDVGSAGLARARASHAEIGTVAGPRTAMQGTGLDGRLVPMTQAHKYSHQGQHLPPRCPVAERGLPARSAHQCQGHQLHNQDRQLHHQFRWSHKTGAPNKRAYLRQQVGQTHQCRRLWRLETVDYPAPKTGHRPSWLQLMASSAA
jgi:hypothetical protein